MVQEGLLWDDAFSEDDIPSKGYIPHGVYSSLCPTYQNAPYSMSKTCPHFSDSSVDVGSTDT